MKPVQSVKKPYIASMCIVEIHEIVVTTINRKMTKELKETKTKPLVFVVALKRAVSNGSSKGRFKISLNFS